MLEALARHYHHLQNEHVRAGLEGGKRRRYEAMLLHVGERFERLLVEWVPDEGLRGAWRAFLQHRGPEPAGPPPLPRLVFRGRSEAGSVAEIRVKRPGELAVEVDGSPVERIAGEGDFATVGAPVRFRLARSVFSETFAVSPTALQALADFCADGGSPPWEHASELLADGLIDVHFDVTPRGRRALAAAAPGL